jgi:hypothetical protein
MENQTQGPSLASLRSLAQDDSAWGLSEISTTVNLTVGDPKKN